MKIRSHGPVGPQGDPFISRNRPVHFQSTLRRQPENFLEAVDIGECFWHDVDDESALPDGGLLSTV